MQRWRERCSWRRVLVGARSPNFNLSLTLSFKSSNFTLPRRLSFSLHLPNNSLFSLRLRSPSYFHFHFFRKLFHSPPPQQSNNKDLIVSGFWVLLPFLVQLHHHVWSKYGNGVFFVIVVMTLACVGFLGVLLMKKGKRTKHVRLVRGFRNWMPFIAAACSILFMMATYFWDRMGIMYVAKQVWGFFQ